MKKENWNIPEELTASLREAAKKMGLNLSALVRHILTKWVNENKEP